MRQAELEAQSMVALDAIEAEDPRAEALLAPILVKVIKHGEREGALDYKGRIGDVAAGQQDPEWAWPFASVDDAYLSAVGSSEISNDIGIPERLWEHISDAWLRAFKRGYVGAHKALARAKKKGSVHSTRKNPPRTKNVTQLDSEIAEALRKRRRR